MSKTEQETPDGHSNNSKRQKEKSIKNSKPDKNGNPTKNNNGGAVKINGEKDAGEKPGILKTVKNGGGKNNGDKEKAEKSRDKNWIMTVVLLTTGISFGIGFITELIYTVIDVSIWRIVVAIGLLVIIIAVNIIADMMGIAATSADEEPFLAMASRKIVGAKRAVSLCRNADRVSSILNDIIGDVCGIISGASGATIAAVLLANYTGLGMIGSILISVAVSAVIAVVTITGKAIAKRSATRKANEITMRLAKFLSIFDKEK